MKPVKRSGERASKAKPRQGLPSGDPRDEEILRAAFAVFAEHGFHKATMLEVASRARASKTTLYTRFRDKEGLFHALLFWGARQNMDKLMAIAQAEDADPEQVLLNYARLALSGMTQPPALEMFRIAAAEGGRQPEVGRIFNSMTHDLAVQSFGRVAERLRRAGRVVFDDPAEFGNCFIGLLRGGLYNQLLLGAVPPPSAAEVERHVRRTIFRLLKAFAPETKPGKRRQR